MKGVARVVAIAVLLAVAGRAGATYRADFFDTSKKPTVTFDKGRMTWTLRNQGVERVIRFDLKAGALQTVAIRDLHTHHALLPVSGGEGAITFASPLLETPTPLTDWKATATNPGAAWTRPDFDDKAWKSLVSSPVRPDAPLYWYRAALPAERLKAGHAYALYFPQGFAGEAEIYANGTLAQSVNASASRKPEQIDLPAPCRSLAVKTLDGPMPPAYVVEVGTSPPALNLTSDWQYMQHTINVGEDNSKILTIHLSGVKRYEGLDLDVCYQVHAGEEPTLAKWFTFVNHRKSRFLMDTVTYERWELPEGFASAAKSEKPEAADGTGSGVEEQGPFVEASAHSGDALMTGAIGAGAMIERGPEGNTVDVEANLNVALKPNQPQQTPKSVTAFWHGSQAVGQFLYQLYVGQYVTSGGPFQTPIAYDTRYAYGDTITAALCEKIAPLAAGLGAQAFILDDGWQANTKPDTGRFGDWIADKTKFPMGIAPVSLLVRENHLRFGLWVDATRVDTRSQQAIQHSEWLYKPLAAPDEKGESSKSDGSRENSENSENKNARMCFTGAWARQFTLSLLSLCREQSVSVLKTRFAPLNGCMSVAHEHLVGQNLPAEQEAWTDFRETLGAIKPEFTLIADAQQGSGGGGMTHGSIKRPVKAPNPDKDAKQAFLMPPYLEYATALCHLPADYNPAPDAVQGQWAAAATHGPNIEIQGDLQQMTTEEREIGRKWIAWNLENRDWLAFAQPVTIAPVETGRNESVTPVHIDGILHLRNALRGRCGYLCVWNRANTAATFTPSFTPADYFVRVKPSGVEIVNIADGKPVPFSTRNGAISLDRTTLSAYGWAIYEIKVK